MRLTCVANENVSHGLTVNRRELRRNCGRGVAADLPA